MFGLCFGIAVNGSGIIETVHYNLEKFGRPVMYTRQDAARPHNQFGLSHRYYTALDRCPLRMS